MVRALLNIYMLIVIIDTILSYLPQFKDHTIARRIKMVSDYSLNPIRKYIVKKFFAQDLGIDISPMILIIAVMAIQALW